MIEIKNIQHAYGNQTVLKEINLNISEGEVFGIVGMNGAGKSTLLNIISGILKPNNGEINFNGKPLTSTDLFYVETRQFFYPWITGKEYLDLFQDKENKFNEKGWAELMHLPLGQLIDEYSTGMKKKLILLAAIKSQRPIWLLDEPFNGLDIESVHLVNKLIGKSQSEGKTILLTSHIFSTLARNCNRIGILKEGSIISEVSKIEFSQLEQELEAYLDRELEEKWKKL